MTLARHGKYSVSPATLGFWSLSRSDRSDPNDKDRLKLLNLEHFLVGQMFPSDREML
jgi:hypothetical protein